jgi:hypothetical protein
MSERIESFRNLTVYKKAFELLYIAHFVSKLSDADGEQAETQHWLDSCIGGCPRIMSVTKKSENETKFSQI